MREHEEMDAERMRDAQAGRPPAMVCICPKCKYMEPQSTGTPCIRKRCPRCGSMMVRGR
jgi:hypothetical protein